MDIKQQLNNRVLIGPDANKPNFSSGKSCEVPDQTGEGEYSQPLGINSDELDEIPPALAEIANGRDHIDTPELGRVTHHANQTIRKLYSQEGHYFGIRPIKIGNKLLWPVRPVARLLRIGGE
jgi:hypothetical protein